MTTISLNPRVAAFVLRKLAQSMTPVEKAAARAERGMNRLFLQAIKDAQDVLPLAEIEASLSVSPGAGGPVLLSEDAVSAMVATLLGSDEAKPSRRTAVMRTAEYGPTPSVLNTISNAMAAGGNANETCAIEPTLVSTSKQAGGITIKQSQILKIWDASKAGKHVSVIATESGFTQDQVKWVLLKIKTQSGGMMKVLGQYAPSKVVKVPKITPPKSVAPTPPPPSAPTPPHYVPPAPTKLTPPAPTTGDGWPIADVVPRAAGQNYERQVASHYKRWEQTLTMDEHQALREYTGSGYGPMNRYYRSVEPDKYISEHTVQLAHNAQQALLKAPTPPPPELVWRGSRNAGARDFVSKLQAGQTIELKGFQSTTINPDFAISWGSVSQEGGSHSGVLWEILPKRGAWVGDISSHSGEKEFLLPHGQQYRVRGIRKVPIKSWDGVARHYSVVQLEML